MAESKNESSRVLPESLPLSLCHLTREEAMNDAKDLLCLIEDFMGYAHAKEDNIPIDTIRGIELVAKLARDKADIGTGTYLFPLIGCHDDNVLCERVSPE